MMRVLALVVVVSLTTPWPALPCSCVSNSFEQALEGADAVFVGKVIRVEILHNDGVVDPFRAMLYPLRPEKGVTARAVLEPLKEVKGKLPKEVEFVTNNGCCDCSLWFDVGETYLIFASARGGTLTTSICSGSVRLKDVTDDQQIVLQQYVDTARLAIRTWHGVDLDSYCKSLGERGVVLVENTAYGWKCTGTDGSELAIDMFDVCRWQYNGTFPLPLFTDFDNANSWTCTASQ